MNRSRVVGGGASPLGMLLVSLLALAPSAGAQVHEFKLRGRWTSQLHPWSTNVLDAGGTHSAVLRGNNDTTWVLHWHDGENERIWMAKPMTDTSAAWGVPLNNQRLFCAGHAQLDDGRLLVVGGTTVQHTGLGGANIFDPKTWYQSTKGWTVQDTMNYGRWYPQATLLGDGKVLVASGYRYFHMAMFGGDIGTVSGDLRPLTLSSLPPARWNDDPTTSGPAARVDHAGTLMTSLGVGLVVHGGVGAAGDTLGDLWYAKRTDINEGERWSWTRLLPNTANGPAGRSRHSLVQVGFQSYLILFGGKRKVGGSDAVVGDVWRFALGDGTWSQIVPTGSDSIGPRYGHTAVYVPQKPFDTGNGKMLVFGGRQTVGGAPVGGSVWALNLPQDLVNGSYTWSQMTVSGTSPSAREGHTAFLDAYKKRGTQAADSSRILFFGGRSSTALLNDVSLLIRSEAGGTAPDQWLWRGLPTQSTPVGRARHSAVHDQEWDRMVVFGGDITLGGARTNAVWTLSMNQPGDPSPTWQLLATDSVPAARSGHVAAFYAFRPTLAQIDERFTASAGSPPGSWQKLDLLGGPKLQAFYPHTFLLRSGKLFVGTNGKADGDDRRRYVFDHVNQIWTTPQTSSFIGGCSVLLPVGPGTTDTVLTCGTNDLSSSVVDKAERATIDSATSSITLSTVPEMWEPRRFHNLTYLPTGQLLMSGGVQTLNNEVFAPTRLVNPRASTKDSLWGRQPDTLASDPVGRKYHSTAALLPDGRILCGGGDPTPTQPTIFWPPYLFKTDGGLATRPSTWLWTDVVEPGGNLWLYVSGANVNDIAQVTLIAPTSVTHQVNMAQRFASLSFVRDSIQGRLRAVAPPTVNRTPPGNYLMFAVKRDSTPSIARWVRLRSESSDGIAPGADVSLAADIISPSTVSLIWIAPGDDGTGSSPGATAYDLRYSTAHITDLNWGSAAPVPASALPVPNIPGLEDVATATGLLPCKLYYFRLKTRDEAGNWSALSNEVAQSTSCGGSGLMAGGGGGEGGGSLGMAAATEGHPNLVEAAGARFENSLLDDPSGPAMATDVCRLEISAGATDAVRIAIRQGSLGATALDRVSLLAVDHPAEIEAFTHGGSLVLGSCQPVHRVTSSLVGDVTSLLTGSAPAYMTQPGETFVIRPSSSGAAPKGAALVLTSARGQGGTPPDSVGFLIQEPGDEPGQWTTRVRHFPRVRPDPLLAGPVRGDSLRVVSLGSHALARLAWLLPVPAIAQDLELVSGRHSRDGEVAAALMSADGATCPLQPRDTLELEFRAPAMPVGQVRDLFLVVRGGIVTSAPTASAAIDRDPEAPRSQSGSLPTRFELHQNQPNPFAGTTTMRFDVPRSERLRIEIHDIQGRLVQRLTDAEYAAGRWSVTWTGRGEAGRSLPAGIYICRLRAAGIDLRRKLVLYP